MTFPAASASESPVTEHALQAAAHAGVNEESHINMVVNDTFFLFL